VSGSSGAYSCLRSLIEKLNRRNLKVVAALSESLLDDAKRSAFLADAQEVLDAEVSDKGGASGLAVKGGYAAIKKVSPTIVADALESFAPKFVEQLGPFRGPAGRQAGRGRRGAAHGDRLPGRPVRPSGPEEGLLGPAFVGEEECRRGASAAG
jgi:hypothetical protein